MTLRQYLILMTLMTVLCWVGWAAVVRSFDPIDAGIFGLLLFYAALGLALAGTFAIAGLTVRSLIRRKEPPSRHVPVSFRQGAIFAAMFVAGLLLQSRSLLVWWNLALLLGSAVTVEFLLMSLRGKSH